MLKPLLAFAVSASFFATPYVAALSSADIASDTPVSSLLSSAQRHLSKGETSEALLYYDIALGRDPSDYLTYFKRATTHLSLGKTSRATEDFNTVLSIKPDFEGAHLQLAKLKVNAAEWDSARQHYLLAGKSYESAEVLQLEEAREGAHRAQFEHDASNWDDCTSHADTAIIVANRAASLRKLRARCRLERGSLELAMGDLQHLIALRPADVSPHIMISIIASYGLGDLNAGLTQIRKCLHSDQESKICKSMLKRQKVIEKTMSRVHKAFENRLPMSGAKLLAGTKDEPGLLETVKSDCAQFISEGTLSSNQVPVLQMQVTEMLCRAYYEADGKKTKQYCEESLDLNPNSFYGTLYRGKVQFEAELFEAAVESYKKAHDLNPSQQQLVADLLRKAEIALKRSQTKDYYKVIGVSTDANDRQIKSAYRKLSKLYHPDKAISQGITKEEAEKKMAQINEAYEVLITPELRERFDRGDDPNSQSQPQQPFGHPFGGGNPFMNYQGGGSGGHGQQYNFKFGPGGGGFGF